MAKYVFLYILALITLAFTATGVGQIVFQIINSIFPETTFSYSSGFSQNILRAGLASVIITAPIYFTAIHLINRDLHSKKLPGNAGIRRWLTYLIFLISSVIAIGFLISILNNFLRGELTVKFLLKSLTAILISILIFLFYLYDLKRKIKKKEKVMTLFAFGFIIIIIASIITGFFYIDSPFIARGKREDNERINNLQNIEHGIENYYKKHKKLPTGLEILEEQNIIKPYRDPLNNEAYEYKLKDEKTYNLCTNFAYSNKDKEEIDQYINMKWRHDKGKVCFKRSIVKDTERTIPMGRWLLR